MRRIAIILCGWGAVAAHAVAEDSRAGFTVEPAFAASFRSAALFPTAASSLPSLPATLDLPERIRTCAAALGLAHVPTSSDFDPGSEFSFTYRKLLQKPVISRSELRAWLQSYKDFLDRETALAHARSHSQ